MAVSITFSQTSLGLAQATPVDQGSIAPGAAATATNLYIRHNGAAAITACAVYIQPYAGGAYSGSGTPNDDFQELLCWGDALPASSSGSGVYVNINATGGTYQNCTSIRGSSEDNAIDLTVDSIVTGTPTVDGEIGVGAQALIHIRVDVPATVSCDGGPPIAPAAGLRQFDVVMVYTSV